MPCKTCGESDPEKFRTGNLSRCTACVDKRATQLARERRLRNPEKYARKFREQKAKQKAKDPHCQKGWQVKHAYNITFEDYARLLESQDFGCAICSRVFDDFKIDGRYGDVDHDHACCDGPKSCGECVRGILCHLCNKGLGFFADSPQRLEAAKQYLERAK